jgi:hypothetical protein
MCTAVMFDHGLGSSSSDVWARRDHQKRPIVRGLRPVTKLLQPVGDDVTCCAG